MSTTSIGYCSLVLCIETFCLRICHTPYHGDVIKWKHFSRYWPFARGMQRSPKPVTRSINVFFDLHLKKWLNKHSNRRWFETSLRSLRRHCDGWNLPSVTYLQDTKQTGVKINLIYGVTRWVLHHSRKHWVQFYQSYGLILIPTRKSKSKFVERNYLSIPKHQRWSRWIFRMDK